MAIRSLANNTFSRSLLIGNAAYDPSATFLISRTTAAGGEGTITLSSIPQTYKHLQLRIMLRDTYSTSSTNAGLYIRPNSDATASYTQHVLAGNGSAASAYANTGMTSIAVDRAGWTSGGGNTTTYGTTIINILDYASTTKNKTFQIFSGADNNAGTTASGLTLSSGLWQSTAAISSLFFYTGWSAFAAGSTIALYGFTG